MASCTLEIHTPEVKGTIVMIHDSYAARRFFKHELEGYGDRKMEEFSATTLQRDFYDKIIAAATLATMTDIEARHHQCSSIGPVQDAAGTSFEAFTLRSGGKALLVSRPDGVRDLAVWSRKPSLDSDNTITEVYHIPLRPDMPEQLAHQIETHFADGTATLGTILPLATEAAEYAQPALEGIIATLSRDGELERCWQIAAGGCRIVDGVSGPTARGISRDYDSRMSIVERLVETFDTSSDVGFDLRGYGKLCRERATTRIFRSVSAIQFESAVAGHVDDILEIASAAREMRLGGGTCLAYGDTDIRVSVDEFEGRVVYRHDNIDRAEQNVFFTIVNMEGDRPLSIDVYLANSWSHDFATANGIDENEALDPETYDYLIDDIRHSSGKLNEDVLAKKLEAGETPAEGRAYRFDLEAKTLEVFPAAEHTGYLAYVPHMIERDLEALNAVRAGEECGLGTEFQLRNVDAGPQADVERVRPAEYLAGLKTPGLLSKHRNALTMIAPVGAIPSKLTGPIG